MSIISLVLQKEVISITGLTILLACLCVWVGNKIKKSDPLKKPTGVVLLALWLVEIIDNNVLGIVDKAHVKKLGPYIGTIAIYIFISNISGLFAVNAPTQNYSVTLTLALITWIMIQYTSISSIGLKGYVHSFFEPFAVLVIPNVFGKIAPLISMSLRLFGNILSGGIIMSLVYSFTSFISNAILGIFGQSSVFNFIGPIVAPVLHAYFDVFSGFIQMFIFITLTMVFIGNELPSKE